MGDTAQPVAASSAQAASTKEAAVASLAHQHRAATDIQRHVRGYNVRKLLEPGTRLAAVLHLCPAPV